MQNSSGCGGGSSGRAVAFCPGKPGSNPGTDLACFGSQLRFKSFLAGCWAFSKERGIERCILFLLLSSFLLPLSIFVNCNINNEPRGNKIQKEAGKGPYLKKMNNTRQLRQRSRVWTPASNRYIGNPINEHLQSSVRLLSHVEPI